MNLIENLNFANEFSHFYKTRPDYSVVLDGKRNINYLETLCQYCADNDIDISNVDNNDFANAATMMVEYAYAASRENKKVAFWLD